MPATSCTSGARKPLSSRRAPVGCERVGLALTAPGQHDDREQPGERLIRRPLARRGEVVDREPSIRRERSGEPTQQLQTTLLREVMEEVAHRDQVVGTLQRCLGRVAVVCRPLIIWKSGSGESSPERGGSPSPVVIDHPIQRWESTWESLRAGPASRLDPTLPARRTSKPGSTERPVSRGMIVAAGPREGGRSSPRGARRAGGRGEAVVGRRRTPRDRRAGWLCPPKRRRR
jgi:hypothetical protein